MSEHMAAVATNLREIEDMALRLEARATDQGRRVGREGDRGIPGGDAMVNLASVGSLTDWQRRVEIAEGQYGNGGVDLSSEDPDDLWPAVQVLWFWSEGYRDQLGHDHDDPRWRPSLVSEAKFLRNHDVAEWIWNNEVHWDDYAADVARAKTKLETTLLEGERPERTRVTCDNPVCEEPRRLIRIYADAVAEDRWKCTSCRKLYDEGDFLKANATQLRSESADTFVNLLDAVGTLRAQGRAERTIRKWLEPPAWCDRCTECGKAYRHQEENYCKAKVRDSETKAWVECGGFVERAELVNPDAVVHAYCEIGTHKVWVWWPDLWTRHRNTAMRKRMVAA